MRALIESSKHSSSATSSNHSASPVASDAGRLAALTQPPREADEGADMDMGYTGSDEPASVSLDRDNGMDDALGRPPSMEHVLTEDGEPMLNPGVFNVC